MGDLVSVFRVSFREEQDLYLQKVVGRGGIFLKGPE
jgi:hypothetical protein